MRRNCNLELRLFPSYDPGHHHHHHQQQHPMMEEASETSPQQHLQKLTICYDGKISVCDVTELQARSILMLANKEMEGRLRTPNGSEPSSPTLPLFSPGTGLSMKRSLQRFLQKRKNRIQEASPYNH